MSLRLLLIHYLLITLRRPSYYSLTMPQWDFPAAGLATFLTLAEIHSATAAFTPQDAAGDGRQQLPHAQREPADTPVLRLIQAARDKGYETICLPLTTERWKDRWQGMCFFPSSPAKDEGGDDLVNADAEIEAKKKEQAAAAEHWRTRPAFLPDEVTITRLDEATGIVAMISDWLELDAEDDGIRHDAEIVRHLFLLFLYLA
jgi:protein arginine N-methyltransferase 5